MKIWTKTHQIALFKTIFSGKHAPRPHSKSLATPRCKQLCGMQLTQQTPKKLGLPWQKPCIYAYGLLLRYLLEEIARRIHAGRQLIVCSTLYVYALQNLFRGKND